MFKYIISWVILYSNICPVINSVPDKFGRQERFPVVSQAAAAACNKTKQEKRTKSFVNRDSAIAFYQDALSAPFTSGEIATVKIDSVKN